VQEEVERLRGEAVRERANSAVASAVAEAQHGELKRQLQALREAKQQAEASVRASVKDELQHLQQSSSRLQAELRSWPPASKRSAERCRASRANLPQLTPRWTSCYCMRRTASALAAPLFAPTCITCPNTPTTS